jgi:hypothetical protein
MSFIAIRVEAQLNNQGIHESSEDVLRKAMENVAFKYYQSSAVEVINKNIFKKRICQNRSI